MASNSRQNPSSNQKFLKPENIFRLLSIIICSYYCLLHSLYSKALTVNSSTAGCRHNRGNNEHSHRNGRHRDHTCDSSWPLIKSAAALMAERHPENLEFVLWTGYVQ